MPFTWPYLCQFLLTGLSPWVTADKPRLRIFCPTRSSFLTFSAWERGPFCILQKLSELACSLAATTLWFYCLSYQWDASLLSLKTVFQSSSIPLVPSNVHGKYLVLKLFEKIVKNKTIKVNNYLLKLTIWRVLVSVSMAPYSVLEIQTN